MKVTKDFYSIDAFLTDIITKYGDTNNYTHTTTLHTFGYCSEYELELDGSTIDALVLEPNEDGNIRFVYNENESVPEFDWIEHFSLDGLFEFAEGLKGAIESELGVEIDAEFVTTKIPTLDSVTQYLNNLQWKRFTKKSLEAYLTKFFGQVVKVKDYVYDDKETDYSLVATTQKDGVREYVDMEFYYAKCRQKGTFIITETILLEYQD